MGMSDKQGQDLNQISYILSDFKDVFTIKRDDTCKFQMLILYGYLLRNLHRSTKNHMRSQKYLVEISSSKKMAIFMLSKFEYIKIHQNTRLDWGCSNSAVYWPNFSRWHRGKIVIWREVSNHRLSITVARPKVESIEVEIRRSCVPVVIIG